MTRSIQFLALCIAFGAMTLASCTKDETTADIITGGCWHETKVEFQDAGQTAWTIDVVDACFKDDCYTFEADGKVNFDQGGLKCDPTDPQTSTGTWTLSSDGKTLTFPYQGLPIPWAIESVSETTLVVIFDFSGDKSRLTFTR